MPYTSITRATLRTFFLNQLDNIGPTFWRTDELNGLMQEGLRFFNLCVGYWRGRAIINTVANQSWYFLPNTITSNMRVSFTDFTMSPASAYDLDFGRSHWESETTASGGDVPTRPKCWLPMALNLIAIWPADAAGNNSLVLDGVLTTPILVNDASTVDIGQEELTQLLCLLQHLAAFKEGGKEFAATQDEFKQFLQWAGQRNAILRQSATYRRWLGLDRARKQKPLKVESDDVGVH